MAERYAVATGNWSSTSTWDGGTTLPGAGDTVHANGFTVTVDQDITVTAITTAAGATASAGGGFATSGNRTHNCNVIAGTTDCLSRTSGTSPTINGNVTGGTSSNADGISSPGGTAGTVTVTGNVTGGTATSARGINFGSNGSVVINGNLLGGAGGSAQGLRFTGSSGSGTVTINGNVTGGGGSAGFEHVGSAEATINGDVTANSTPTGVNMASSAGNVIINGKAIAGSSGNAVDNNSTSSACIVDEIEFASNGFAPIEGKSFVSDVTLATIKAYESGGTNAVLAAPGVGGGRRPRFRQHGV